MGDGVQDSHASWWVSGETLAWGKQKGEYIQTPQLKLKELNIDLSLSPLRERQNCSWSSAKLTACLKHTLGLWSSIIRSSIYNISQCPSYNMKLSSIWKNRKMWPICRIKGGASLKKAQMLELIVEDFKVAIITMNKDVKENMLQ